MRKRRVAVLYICTGRYSTFWAGFYASAKANLFIGEDVHYFVFTDSPTLEVPSDGREVTVVHQSRLGWPHDTLKRFEIFERVIENLTSFDAIYFFNANTVIQTPLGADIWPDSVDGLVVCKHPGYYNRPRRLFPYETNPKSRAYIANDRGEHYFAGGLNGGMSKVYIAMIRELASAIRDDESRGIIARWHDESHINRYATSHASLKILPASYLYPEGTSHEFEPRILVLDKSRFGGHDWLRGERHKKRVLGKMRSRFYQWIKHLTQR